MESINSIINSIFSVLTFEKISGFVFHPDFVGLLLFVKIIFIIVSAALIINIFYLISMCGWMNVRYVNDYKEFKGFESGGAQDISKKWKGIKHRVETGKEVEYKLAVIEAEESLIDILRMMGFDGPTFEDQLRQAGSDDISNIRDVVNAHKVRNGIVADPNRKLSPDEAKKTIAAYEKAFSELQA